MESHTHLDYGDDVAAVQTAFNNLVVSYRNAGYVADSLPIPKALVIADHKDPVDAWWHGIHGGSGAERWVIQANYSLHVVAM